MKRTHRKTLRLEITPALEILVRAPAALPQREIDRFVAQHSAWIDLHLDRQRQRLEEHPPLELSRAEIDALRQKARDILPGRIQYYSARMGLVPTGIKITGARTRFGSCSGRNSLCFSWRLMLYPPEAVDLVVVHELAHIRHKNHGPDFYALLASELPDHKQRKKLLKRRPFESL